MRAPRVFVTLGAMFGLVGWSSAFAAEKLTPVFDVDNPDRMPYQETVSFSINNPFVNQFGNFPTPEGMRYVVEFVAVQCQTPSATDVFPQALLTVGRNASNGQVLNTAPVLIMTRTGPGGLSGYVHSGSAQVKLYADGVGGSSIYINVFHTEVQQTANCFATVTGHALLP